ncbi:MAG TPA: signal peptidase I, partial [Acidimicrobiales bacterium]|nr:signal peptidase I [Acidimicrobiales bacterium]
TAHTTPMEHHQPTATRKALRRAAIRSRRRSVLTSTGSRLVGWLGAVLLAVVILGVCAVMAGAAMGYRALTIRSGSMTPTLAVGAVVIDRSVSPLQVQPGEIVTFRDPKLHQQLVTHRVISMRRSGDRVYFVTKGDANVVTEQWDVPVTARIGHELLVLPSVGRMLGDVSLPMVRVVALAVLALWLAVVGLRWIWRDPVPAGTGCPATPG